MSFNQKLHVAKHEIKLVCSCIRGFDSLQLEQATILKENTSPTDGDLVLVRSLSDKGAYDEVEDQHGMPIKVYRGDCFVGVLATRTSGTNLIGLVPEGTVRSGDTLSLVAQGGLVANCVSVPAYYKYDAMALEVIGFLESKQGSLLNISQNSLPVSSLNHEKLKAVTSGRIIFVSGTSAEVGKTTFVSNLNLYLKENRPSLVTTAIKACGTGRAKDTLNYKAARFDSVYDFVDAGVPSTYHLGSNEYRDILLSLINNASDSDYIIVEIGGDFLEANAPAALELMADLNAECAMMTNDAMGAMEGIRRLKKLNVEPMVIGSFRQNLYALAKRLGVPEEKVIDPSDRSSFGQLNMFT